MNNELKKCPFCGSSYVEYETIPAFVNPEDKLELVKQYQEASKG